MDRETTDEDVCDLQKFITFEALCLVHTADMDKSCPCRWCEL